MDKGYKPMALRPGWTWRHRYLVDALDTPGPKGWAMWAAGYFLPFIPGTGSFATWNRTIEDILEEIDGVQ